MTLDDKLRIIASSAYWQSLYTTSLQCSNIQLFNNVTDFSGLQVRLLYWLSIYKMLYEELGTFEDDRLSEEVLKNNYRIDAYLIYRNKKNDFAWKQHRQDEREANRKSGKKQWKNTGNVTTCDIDFRRE